MPLSISTAGVPQLTIIHTTDPISNDYLTRGNDSHLNSSTVNSRLQLCLEMVFIAVQIVACVVLLALSNHNRSQTPFRDLIISYVILCLVALSLLCWDYYNIDQTSEQDSDISIDICFQRIILFETFLPFLMEDDARSTIYRTRSILYSESPSPMQLPVNSSRILLNVFFGYWLILSGMLLKTSTQPSEAFLYWMTWLFFSHGLFEYILALFVCPVISIAGVQAKQGAQSEVINALPTRRFKLKKDTGGNDESAASNSEEGGVVAAGTNMERVISAEDAACSICLGIYADNDELRELPCYHLLHKDCVDKWLIIKASCPLCKRLIC